MTPPIFTTSGACRQAVQQLLKEKSSTDTPILASASCLYRHLRPSLPRILKLAPERQVCCGREQSAACE